VLILSGGGAILLAAAAALYHEIPRFPRMEPFCIPPVPVAPLHRLSFRQTLMPPRLTGATGRRQLTPASAHGLAMFAANHE